MLIKLLSYAIFVAHSKDMIGIRIVIKKMGGRSMGNRMYTIHNGNHSQNNSNASKLTMDATNRKFINKVLLLGNFLSNLS